MSTTLSRVLIISHANWEGLSRLPRLLKSAGCEVSLIAPSRNFIAHSSCIHHYYPAPENLDACLVFLQEHLALHAAEYQWIIVGDDPLLYGLGKLRAHAWARKIMPCTDDDRCIDFIVSKIGFIQTCAQAGLRVPYFQICSSHQDLQQAATRLGWPLVIKQSEGFGGNAVAIVPDAAALAHVPIEQKVIAQAFVPGRVGSAAALFRHGKLLCYFSYFRSRTWGALGVSTAIQIHALPELAGILRQLGNCSGFHGLCGIDFIEHQDTKQLYLLEQNFRPTLTLPLGKRAGVDFCQAISDFLKQEQADFSPLQQSRHGAIVPLFPGDILRALDAKDWKGLLKWLCYPHWWSEMGWQDARLLTYNFRYIARFSWNKATHLLKSQQIKF
jgi:glutathione synthase/RimK-type ligase-like ATP-grasp enzyme